MHSTLNPHPTVRAREAYPQPSPWLTLLALLATVVGTNAVAQSPSVDVKTTSLTTSGQAVKPFSDITLAGFPKTINIASVYIENNEPGDLLTATVSNTKITATFDKDKCLLTLTGNATPAEFQALLKGVEFKPVSKLTHSRQAFVSVGPGLAHKVNGENHYYEFVNGGLTWDAAKKAAEERKYLGVLPGYLVTITSAAEQAFLQDKMKQQGWMGASDAKEPETWRWVTGPEGKEDGGKGQVFTYGLKGNGIDKTKQGGIKPAPYTNWKPGEPNNFGGKEGYGHFFENGIWNDYAADNGSIKGYLVEYGEMGQTLDVSAEVNIVPPTIRMNASGDVHFHTPDGLLFDYQGTGDYVALQSKDRTAVIHARQTPWGNNTGASVTTAVAMSVAGDTVELQVQGGKTVLTVNGKPAVLTQDADLPQGGRIESTAGGNSLTVYWPKNAFMATVNLRGKYLDYGVANLSMPPSFEGLLGTLDGKADNDYLCRDGKVIKAPADVPGVNTFGDSWRIGKEDKPLFTTPAPQASPHAVAVIEAERREVAKAEVDKAGITGLVERYNAVYDYALTQDKSFLESAATQDAARAAMTPAEKAKVTAGDAMTQGLLEQENREVTLKEAKQRSQGKWAVNWQATKNFNQRLAQQPDWAKLTASEFGLNFKDGALVTSLKGKDQPQSIRLFKTENKNWFGVSNATDEEAPQIAELNFLTEKVMVYRVHNVPDFPFPLVLEKR